MNKDLETCQSLAEQLGAPYTAMRVGKTGIPTQSYRHQTRPASVGFFEVFARCWD
jgi:hypothetical protein